MNFYDDKEDYFETPADQEVPKQPKKPVLKPEDPDYWDESESEFEHLRPTRKWILWAWGIMIAICLAIGIGVYMHFFKPEVSEAVQYGYVDDIQEKGKYFKTYEGVMIPYKEIMDTTRTYNGDFVFSVKDGAVAASLLRLQLANLPARVTYKKYSATLPWRGESKIVVVKADTADASKILPPEFNPIRN